jgi:ATP dependent DNA ligase C terminal region
MKLYNPAKLEIKLGEYRVGQGGALTDPLLVARCQDYRRYIASRMVPLEPDHISKRFTAADYHVSLKVDGEFNLLLYSEGEILLVNPGGTVRVGLPFQKEAVEHFQAAGVKQAFVAGELHFTQSLHKRGRVHDVTRFARQPGSQKDLEGLSFAAFDLLELNNAPWSAPLDATWKKLNELFGKGKRCHLVEGVWLKDAAAIHSQYTKWVQAGGEGAVVRSDAIGSFKIKARHTLDAVVIGFTEGTDDRRGMMHDLLLAVMRPDGNLHVLGHVGGGFSLEERQHFLSDLKDMVVASDYVEVNDHVAYHMVRPQWVVEISVLEMISHSTRGTPVKTMVINWNREAHRYEVVRRLPLVNLTSPQFVRRREDKTVNQTDIRISQVSDLVEVPLADKDSRVLNMPTSEVLKREVYTKTQKDELMVRKLVMWQTRKEMESEDYPAFVIHYTDFSPNRKTPLEREIRVSSSREQIEQLWTELATEAFKKGWVPSASGVPAAAAAPKADLLVKTPSKRGKAAETPAAPAEEPAPPSKGPPKKRGKAEAIPAETTPSESTEATAKPKKPAARKKKGE